MSRPLNIFIQQVRDSIFEPKKKELIQALANVVTGKEPTYIHDYSRERHYQIWFYDPFDLNFIFIGDRNFVVNVSSKADDEKLLDLREEYQRLYEKDTNKYFDDVLRHILFEFFSDCWAELENQLSKRLRCFLIEYGIIRGLDVNTRLLIDGEKIGDVLENESTDNN